MLKNIENKLFLIIPISVLSILSIFLFFAYEIKFIDGTLNIKSKVSDEVKSNLIDKESPILNLASFPNKDLPTEIDLKSKNYKLVNFWASWCAPCRSEHKNLIAISKLGYKVFGINYKDNLGNATSFLDELGNPYHKIGTDKDGEAAIAWGVYGIPETFLIDSNNKIIVKIAGPITSSIYEKRLKKYLEP